MAGWTSASAYLQLPAGNAATREGLTSPSRRTQTIRWLSARWCSPSRWRWKNSFWAWRYAPRELVHSQKDLSQLLRATFARAAHKTASSNYSAPPYSRSNRRWAKPLPLKAPWKQDRSSPSPPWSHWTALHSPRLTVDEEVVAPVHLNLEYLVVDLNKGRKSS